jgi:hypothetical protein
MHRAGPLLIVLILALAAPAFAEARPGMGLSPDNHTSFLAAGTSVSTAAASPFQRSMAPSYGASDIGQSSYGGSSNVQSSFGTRRSGFFSGGFSLPMVLLALLCLYVYMIPTIVAYRRHHPRRQAIALLNILAGATAIGWVGALIWALITPQDFSNANPVAAPATAQVLASDQTKICPSCAETIKEAAIKCRFCGHRFDTPTA